MADRVVVSVGTKKGLFLFESNARRKDWKLRGPFLEGWSVYHACVDTRRGAKVHAAGNSDVFATNTFSADLKSAKFVGAKKGPVPPKPHPKHEKVYKMYGIARAPRTWHIEPGRKGDKGVLYAGTAPAGLFRTENDGKTWEPVKGINEHPTRPDWNPGFGGMCAHSIQLDPDDERRMYVAISAAGAFRSDDGGKTFKPINKAVSRYVGAPKDSAVGT